jgi:MFS family permease
LLPPRRHRAGLLLGEGGVDVRGVGARRQTELPVFGLASVAGGPMDSPGQLIAARAVMGVGAAIVFPSTLSLLTNVFQRGWRARPRAVGSP